MPLVVGDADLNGPIARPALSIDSREGNRVDAPPAGSGTLGTDADSAIFNHRVRAGVAIAEGVEGLILRDTGYLDRDVIAVGIRHSLDADRNEFVVRRPEYRRAGMRLGAHRRLIGSGSAEARHNRMGRRHVVEGVAAHGPDGAAVHEDITDVVTRVRRDREGLAGVAVDADVARRVDRPTGFQPRLKSRRCSA